MKIEQSGSPKVVELKILEPTEAEKSFREGVEQFIALSPRLSYSDIVTLLGALRDVLVHGRDIPRAGGKRGGGEV